MPSLASDGGGRIPRSGGKLPALRHHQARNLAVVRLNGVDHYLGPRGSVASRAESDRLIAAWLAAGRQPILGPGQAGDLRVVELLARFWAHATAHYRRDGQPTREIDSVRVALRPLQEQFGPTPAVTDGRPLRKIRLEQVALVGDGNDAFQAARWDRPDLVFKHMNLPELGRFDAARALRRSGVDRPLSAPAAHAMQQNRDRALEAGCDAHLTRPVDLPMPAVTLARFQERSDCSGAPPFPPGLTQRRRRDDPVAKAVVEELRAERCNEPDFDDFLPVIRADVATLRGPLRTLATARAADDHEDLATGVHRIRGSAGRYGD